MSRLTVSNDAMCPFTGNTCAADKCALSMSDPDEETTWCAFGVIATNLDIIATNLDVMPKADRCAAFLMPPATSRTFDPEDPDAWEQCTGYIDGERVAAEFFEFMRGRRHDGTAATADVGGEPGARGASGDAE